MRPSIGVCFLGAIAQLASALIFLASAPALNAQGLLPPEEIIQAAGADGASASSTQQPQQSTTVTQCTYPTVQKEPGVATLQADSQHRTGNTSYADGCVEIDYDNLRLRANHVEYNDDTKGDPIERAHGQRRLSYRRCTRHDWRVNGDCRSRFRRSRRHSLYFRCGAANQPEEWLLRVLSGRWGRCTE